MIEKEVRSRNNFKTALLVVTISIFFLFSIIFFISINYFETTQHRISKLIELTNYKDAAYENTLDEFLKAEKNFRKYIIDLDINYYKEYQLNIKNLDNQIGQILETHRQDSSKNLHGMDLLIGQNKYLLIHQKLRGIIELSPTIDSIQAIITNTQSSKPLSTKNLNIDVQKVIKTPQKQEKSLFDKILKKSNTPTIDHEVLEAYNTEVDDFSKRNSRYFNRFKTQHETLRKSERELLAKHFNILYTIYRDLHEINELQIIRQKTLLQSEHEEFFVQSSNLTWQTILCLVFIFILIVIMIYYQFRNKYYEKQLIKEQQYAAKLASEKSDILAEISHEIRTPINSLIGIIDLLRKRPNIYSEKEQLFLNSAYSNITNTSHTINDILNLSKIDYSAVLDFSDFDIEELANDIYQIHKSQAELKNIELEVLVDKNLPTLIHSDELKIRQILTNLISNGIKYTMHGKVSCKIRINELNNLYIKVSDTGLGISEEMQDNIFKKYFTKSIEKKLSNGIGLGLYITKRLVHKLQGNITFTSKENFGTTFMIEIPIPTPKKKINASYQYKTLADFPNDISWLLVDDNVLNILYLKQFFQTFTEVKSANNGLEALEVLKNYIPDFIITDINMPIMTGDELLMYIKQSAELHNTKVIATSSDYEQIRELEIKRNVTFDNVIIKPFNEKDLVKIINQTIFKATSNN